jgi:mono/diheme cytochrome c family protein
MFAAGAVAAQDEVPPVAAAPAAPEQQPPAEPSATGPVDPRIELYVSKCASCHTVGKGDRVGPDLSGVHQRRDRAWLEQMIGTPSSLLSSDADARNLLLQYGGVKMPDLGLTAAEVSSLIDLVTECSDVPCVLAGQFVPVAEATPLQIDRGRALFAGNEPFAGGGVACLSCHTVRGLGSAVPGGTLAVDLTHAFARLGDEGLDVALKNPVFPVMNKVFTDHPLETDEAFALRAFLNAANSDPTSDSSALSLPLFGLLVAGAVMVMLNAVWGRRLRGVRQPMTRRSAALASAKRRSDGR